jgi:YegS/Rv2252/BmrU family lipid kinase
LYSEKLLKRTNKILFIVNPFAGVSSKKSFPKLVENQLKEADLAYEIVYTQGIGHATELAKEGVEKGVDIVAAVGGDGTVNEVAQGLIGTETALGIIPGGSGNGLSMHLGIGRNPIKALNILRNPDFIRIDTCKINDKPFLNMAGTGIDAMVAQKTSGFKHRGFLPYLLNTLKLSLYYENREVKVHLDNEVREGRFLSVNLANGSMFGYNFVVAPSANVQDGNLHVVLMHHAPKWKYFMHSWRLLNKTIHKAPFVEIMPVKTVSIHASVPLYLHIDGNGYEPFFKDFMAEVIPKSLLVAVPRKRKSSHI